MYRILVVDDEELICAGIKTMIESLGRQDIGEIRLAYEGRDAIGIIHETRPDIVVTDIRLTDISGLDIIRDINKHGYDIKFIVLSGYEDFNYAKEAIKLGVVDYLLKPASLEELGAVLNSAVGSLQRQKLVKDIDSGKYRKTIMESKLNRIFSNRTPVENMPQSMLDELLTDFQNEYFCSGIVRFESNVFSNREIDDIDEIITNLSDSLLRQREITTNYFFDYSNGIVLFFNCSDICRYSVLLEFMKALGHSLIGIKRTRLLSALSEMGSGAGSIMQLVSQCRGALAYRLLYNICDVIEYKDIKNKLKDTDTLDRELDELSVSWDGSAEGVNKLGNYIDRIFCSNVLKGLDIECIGRHYKRVLDAAGSLLREDRQIPGFSKDFGSFDSLSDLRIYLKETLHKISELLKNVPSDRTIADIAKRYIRENLSRDISLTVVANVVSMNYSYFSKLFKNQTGMNLSDYIIKTRMEEAKRLLNDPLKKINEICTMVGYPSPKHFTRAFKNYAGISPKDYQKR